MESFEANEYRDNAAKELKATPKSDRLELLRSYKINSDEYHEARQTHQWDRLDHVNEANLKRAIESAETIHELKKKITAIDILISNRNLGYDHTENLVKQIEMAEYFNDPSLINETANLRNKYISLATKEGIGVNGHVNGTSYAKYLLEQYPAVDFGPHPERMYPKLPPEVFGSIDVAMEEPILLANSIDGVRTRFSCSGHDDGGHTYELASYYAYAYLILETQSEEIALKLGELTSLDEHVIIDVNTDLPTEGNDVFSVKIYFTQFPSEDWLKQNKKRTPEQILEDTDKFKPEKTKEFFTRNPEAALEHEAFNRKMPERFLKFDYIHELNTEYKEFNRSVEAKKTRNEFIQKLKEKLRDISGEMIQK